MTEPALPDTPRAVIDAWLDHVDPYPQYHGWLTEKAWDIRPVKERIGGNGTFVRAEPGDLVLVFPAEPRGYLMSFPEYDTAFVPRVGWNIATRARLTCGEPVYVGRREPAAA